MRKGTIDALGRGLNGTEVRRVPSLDGEPGVLGSAGCMIWFRQVPAVLGQQKGLS